MGSSLRVRGAASIVGGALQGVGIIPAHAGSSILNAGTVELGRDHPRACGEQALTRGELAAVGGSSPRVRGAVRVHRRNERRPGIIPACAGSRLGGRCPVGPERDHPRVCGEQHSYSGKVHTFQGSSPRGRGAGVLEGEHRLRRGIIPARAGSRNGATHCPSARRDHPRACGEQVERSIMSMGVTRSSPRMRGAVLLIVTSPLDSGIIPACAGSSGCARGRCGARRGHPRVCGEQYLLSYTAMPPAGSSPRVRGAVHEVGRVAQAHGIIPARAGSRTQRGLDIGSSRDHPRACGEQSWTFRDDETSVGSSPRVRGAAATHHDRAELMRIIPARAGSSVSPDPSSLEWGDHPRACGEQATYSGNAHEKEGSSPRVRGAVIELNGRGV